MAVIAVAAVIAFIGPFGTFDELSLWQRLLYWQVIANLSWWQWQALDHAVHRLALRAFGREILSWLQRGLLVSLVTPVPVVAEVRLLRTAMDLRTGIPNLELYLWIAGTSLAIFATVSGFLRWAHAERGSPEQAPMEAPEKNREARFLARLPVAKRGALLCIKTEDHYLRVYTDAGEDLILLRFGDALSELEGADGLRVHRSHWVARRALEAAKRDGRKTRLDLVNGLEVPVSDTYLPDLKAAGWIP